MPSSTSTPMRHRWGRIVVMDGRFLSGQCLRNLRESRALRGSSNSATTATSSERHRCGIRLSGQHLRGRIGPPISASSNTAATFREHLTTPCATNGRLLHPCFITSATPNQPKRLMRRHRHGCVTIYTAADTTPSVRGILMMYIANAGAGDSITYVRRRDLQVIVTSSSDHATSR